MNSQETDASLCSQGKPTSAGVESPGSQQQATDIQGSGTVDCCAREEGEEETEVGTSCQCAERRERLLQEASQGQVEVEGVGKPSHVPGGIAEEKDPKVASDTSNHSRLLDRFLIGSSNRPLPQKGATEKVLAFSVVVNPFQACAKEWLSPVCARNKVLTPPPLIFSVQESMMKLGACTTDEVFCVQHPFAVELFFGLHKQKSCL